MARAKLFDLQAKVVGRGARSVTHRMNPFTDRDALNFSSRGNRRLAIAPNGKVYIQPAPIDVRILSAMLYQAGREAISLTEMDVAIVESAGESIYSP